MPIHHEDKTIRAIINSLLDSWEKSVHNVDSLLQVVMTVPDWRVKFDDAYQNPLRQQHTTETFSAIRFAVQELLAGDRDSEDVLREIQSRLKVQ